MSSLITHIFIPLFILIVFSEQLNLSKKIIIFLSPFAIFPDIDMFMFHRATLHNLFILTLIPIIIYILIKNKSICLIITCYLYSHTLLDIFNSGVYLFYPIYNKVFNIMAGVSYKNFSFTPIWKIEIITGLSSKSFDMSMISSENIATILLILVITIIYLIKKHISLNTKK